MARDTITYEIGPVAATSARAWIRTARQHIEAIVAAGPAVPFRMPPEVVNRLNELLGEWEGAADGDATFRFVGSEERARAAVLLTYWLNIVSLSEQQRAAIDVTPWPEESTPFERALLRAIIASLGVDERLRRIDRARRRT